MRQIPRAFGVLGFGLGVVLTLQSMSSLADYSGGPLVLPGAWALLGLLGFGLGKVVGWIWLFLGAIIFPAAPPASSNRDLQTDAPLRHASVANGASNGTVDSMPRLPVHTKVLQWFNPPRRKTHFHVACAPGLVLEHAVLVVENHGGKLTGRTDEHVVAEFDHFWNLSCLLVLLGPLGVLLYALNWLLSRRRPDLLAVFVECESDVTAVNITTDGPDSEKAAASIRTALQPTPRVGADGADLGTVTAT